MNKNNYENIMKNIKEKLKFINKIKYGTVA